MKGRVRFAIAAACALVAILASGAYASSVQAQAEQERSEALERYGGEITQLVVAVRELEAGQTVGSSDVELRDWVSQMVPAGSYASVDDIVGQRLTSPVAEGMPLTETSVREDDSAIDVPAGEVATSVAVTERLGLAAGVSVGARLLAYEAEDDGTHLLSDAITVLAVNEGQSALTSGGSVTVAMSPSVVNELLRCASAGSLRLVLPADDVDADELEAYEAPVSVEPLDNEDAIGDAAEEAEDADASDSESQNVDGDGGTEDDD